MKQKQGRSFVISIIGIMLMIGLGCSVGRLLVSAPQPTPTPTKTPKATFTATLIPTETPIPTFTPTLNPVSSDSTTTDNEETNTSEEGDTSEEGNTSTNEEPETIEESPTETPTPTEVPPTATSGPPTATNTPAPPPPPTATPAPTDTPVPSYPYPGVLVTHPTGGEVEFRISGFVWEGDISTGFGEAQAGFQMEVITPNGEREVSEVSVGPSAGDSTVRGAGDNHSMNFQYKRAGYIPGTYKVSLMKDGAQMSPTVEVVAQAGPPFTYAHIDFIKQQ